jgi:hypothetical protein
VLLFFPQPIVKLAGMATALVTMLRQWKAEGHEQASGI